MRSRNRQKITLVPKELFAALNGRWMNRSPDPGRLPSDEPGSILLRLQLPIGF